MAHQETTETEAPGARARLVRRLKRWWQRSTVRALKRMAQEELGRGLPDLDERQNDETRLPPPEAVHLGGLVLTEAFTPSTVSSLYDAFERWPGDRQTGNREWLEQLARSRGGSRGGWQSLGVVRPPGALVMGMGYNDPGLPAGVDAVWLHLSYVTPTLAMVVATFTIAEDAGDLSDVLRRSYQSVWLGPHVSVQGRFRRMREHIPWSRPARFVVDRGLRTPEDQKREASEALIRDHEEACSSWFVAKFRGRFAAAKPADRPVIRLLFTRNEAPYVAQRKWFRPIDLDFALPLWRSTEPEGWWLSEDRWSRRDGCRIMTLAARRGDAAGGPGEPSEAETRESNWYLTQRIGTDHAPLASRHALTALLAIYSDRLADLRDKAGVRRFPSRPVREARALQSYLVRDGLDAATVASDLKSFTANLASFRWGVPEFSEHLEHLGEMADTRPATEYVPSLCARVRGQAERLARDTEMTTGNIRASSELRQAIANTTLQRILLLLAVVAIIVAVVSLVAAQRGPAESSNPHALNQAVADGVAT